MKFLSIIIIILTLSSFNEIKDDKILWNKDKPLTWNDFQGIPKKSSQRSAMTNSGIELKTSFENNTLTITVGAYFIKNKSWVKKEALGDSLLLEHEQVHFDITELFARKFRQKLRAEKLSSKNAEKMVRKIRLNLINIRTYTINKQIIILTKRNKKNGIVKLLKNLLT
jgi:hypothetical protein